MEEVKRRAAEEAMRARLEMEKKEVDVKKEDEETKIEDGRLQDVKKDLTLEEHESKNAAKADSKEEKVDSIKTEGRYRYCHVFSLYIQYVSSE